MHYYFNKHGWEKKVVFLANTVQLVKQQAEAIKRYLPMISRNESVMRFMKDRCGSNHYEVNFTEENVRDWVVCLHGEKNEQVGMTQRRLIETNIRDRKQLMNKIKNARIVVMIAQMFVNSLRRGYTKLNDYVFLVFDECHHCKGEHPYSCVMKEFYFEEKNKQMKAINDADQEITF
jgi:endoribonuclease Dicer